MNYKFPGIKNISDVLPAIEGRDEFVVAVKEGYTVINYNVMMSDTFPEVLLKDYDGELCGYDHNAAILRECRGIIFDTATGNIIRRPFHKFFNVNERDETQEHVVDLSRPHAILEKLDGSMIVPFYVNGQMIWGTKMGATDVAKPVEEYVENHPEHYFFAMWMLIDGYSPIFEWCSRKQRIVLDYKDDQLILTAIRNINTGEYVDYAIMCEWSSRFSDIPVVRAFDPQTDMQQFIEYVRDLQDVEGFVVRFADGYMLKLKCDWYVQIHKAKEKILQDRNIVELILDEKLDDVKAHLTPEERDQLTEFEDAFNLRKSNTVNIIALCLKNIQEDDITRKDFALKFAPNFSAYTRAAIFTCWDNNWGDFDTIRSAVTKTIRNNLSKTSKYEEIRDVWFSGVVYNV